MKKYMERLWNGLIKENPVLVLMLGMCPALAVSTQAANGIGMGLGFTAALTLAGALRELLGTGKIFGAQLLPEGFGMTIFIQPPGAFLVFALIIAVMNAIGIKTRQRQLVESGCDGNCALCSTVCSDRKEETAGAEEQQKALQEAPKAIEAAVKEGGEKK